MILKIPSLCNNKISKASLDIKDAYNEKKAREKGNEKRHIEAFGGLQEHKQLQPPMTSRLRQVLQSDAQREK
jgi:hypothetical protein